MHLVYKVPGTDRAKVREGVKFGSVEGRDLFVDVYQPADLKEGEQRATVLFISGGENVRDWPIYREYGRLAAAQGLVALVPDKRFPRGAEGIINGTADMQTLRKFLAREGAALGVSADRVAFWIFSGGGQLGALGLQASKGDEPPPPKCIVMFYAALDFAPDLVKANPALAEYSPARAVEAAGKAAPPMFLARAGQDMPFLNLALGSFVAGALKGNAPLTLVNYPEGHHAFDALDDRDETRAIMKAAFDFIRLHMETS
jgi:acetyl esterase/lipase